MTETQFQTHVLKYVAVKFPEVSFSRGDDARTLRTPNGYQFGLDNLYRFYLQSPADTGLLHEEISTHFMSILKPQTPDPDSVDWDEAKGLLRPQFMPREFLDQVPGLVSIPFSNGLVVGFVMDGANSYSYLREKDLRRWNLPLGPISGQAIVNLDSITKGVSMSLMDGPIKAIAIATGDGFDAARILLPGLRERLSKHLGKEFTFAVPNRDFLICWPANAPSDFVEKLHGRVKEDFQSQNHPLSNELFSTGNLPTFARR